MDRELLDKPSPAPAAPPAPESAPAEAPVGIVVGHTHWDREWYLPFEGFRARLVAMMDKLVALLEREPRFRCFVLDGQAIAIEDYLEVRTEAEAQIRRLVAAGRIKVGPWYTAVDTFLPDPKSLVRNLTLGRWAARRYGSEPMAVGHLPDTFGFCAQLPQLLRQFGMDDAFAWRGLHPANAAAACWWDSPDGSRVLVLRPPEGYCEGAMGVVDPDRFLVEALPGIVARQDHEPYADRLFVIGCDHFPAGERLPWLADQIAERVGHEVHVGSLEEMAARVRPHAADLPVIRGEQRDPCLTVCPASVCGTRVPLKQANQRIEALLLGIAEPLQALAELAGGGADRAHLRWAWRLLAQNHPHNSIPGCSIDAVHREMMTRFARAGMVAVDAAQRGAKRLAAALDPATRGELGAIGIVGLAGGRGRIRERVYGPETGLIPFRLVDVDGQDVPFRVIGKGEEYIHYHKLQDAFATPADTAYIHLAAPLDWVHVARHRPEIYKLPFVEIEFETDAPWAGYRVLRVERATAAGWRAARARRPVTSGAAIANAAVRVWADERGLWLAAQASGRTYGPVYFSHAGEQGDEYTACPLPGVPPVTFVPDAVRARVIGSGPDAQLEFPIQAQVPARLSADRQGRTGRVRLDGRLVVRLQGARVDLHLDLANRAEDFDLRLITHVPDGVTARSGAPFDVEDRGFEVDHSSPNAPQQWLPDFPFRGWVAAQTPDGAGLAFFARGLYESAVRRAPGGIDIAPTLLRGVGFLSRPDLVTRPGDAGPLLPTPDAQCFGPQAWDLALLPFGPGEADLLPARAEQFLRPPAAFPIQWSAGHAPAAQTLFAGDPQLVVSALKPAEEGTAALIHAHNPTRLTHEAAVAGGTRVRLDETPVEGDGAVGPFSVAAWKLSAS